MAMNKKQILKNIQKKYKQIEPYVKRSQKSHVILKNKKDHVIAKVPLPIGGVFLVMAPFTMGCCTALALLSDHKILIQEDSKK